MKDVILVTVYMLLLSSCIKEGLPSMEKKDPNDGIISYRNREIPQRMETVCINSFDELRQKVGTSLAIKSVLLENGQNLQVGTDVVGMYYLALNTQENNSLFRSQFVVEYRDGDHVVSNTQDIWSLGCKMADRGARPVTNILWNNTIFEINTSFVWSVPPLAVYGYRIIWLVL